MPGLRYSVKSLLGASALLAGLVACASTVSGQPEYVGAGPTTTEETTETTTETTETTTESTSSGPGADELLACSLIPTSDIEAFTAFNMLADKPEAEQTQDMRNSVAGLFDEAQMLVQTYIDPLPEGPIKDAAIGYQAKQIEVRDKLRAGTDVNTQIILDAMDVLLAACEAP